MTANRLPLAISLGDPAGVGPELIAEAWIRRADEKLPPFFIAGGHSVLRQAASLRGVFPEFNTISDPAETADVFRRAIPVLDTVVDPVPGAGTGDLDGDYSPGKPSAAGARLALNSLAQAADLARRGIAGAIVTSPVAKSAIAAIASDFIGQTEFCADICQIARDDAVMLLAGPQLKTVPLTVHCALADVPALLTRELVVQRCRIVARAMRTDFAIASPRLALTGLNPHAGEDGRMGREEIETIAPAIAQLRDEGIDATGPHPADTLFAPHKRASYDVAIAMYHDQALVPLKTLDFDCGVNMTLGLPIVRTSPDHGTAFDIAGKRIASPGAMIAAIRMAGEVSARRQQSNG